MPTETEEHLLEITHEDLIAPADGDEYWRAELLVPAGTDPGELTRSDPADRYRPPTGWTTRGWATAGPNGPADVVTVYLTPPPETQELWKLAAAAGRETFAWIAELDGWGSDVRADAQSPRAHRWYLTDLRHLSNLGSAIHQGHLPRGPLDDTDPHVRAVMLLEDTVTDWLEDHFDDGEENEAE